MKAKNKYYFYIIKYSDGTYCKGYTNNLKMRLKSYNRLKFDESLKKKLPVELIYAKKCEYPCILELETKSTIRKFRLDGVEYRLYDCRYSTGLDITQFEFEHDSYKIKRIAFHKGDVVIDIGGHVGFVSIYLAKKYPFIKIFAFEPIYDNYFHFKKNIRLNKVTNIRLSNRAVTKDGRELEMFMGFSDTGRATAKSKEAQLLRCNYYIVKSLTLDSIFKKYHIKKCKLLKIDCEGSEYEILMHSKQLRRVEYLSGEFHFNKYLKKQGYSPKRLFDYCKRFIKAENISYFPVSMIE